MSLQPPGQRVGASVRQEVHDAAALEVADDRAPAVAAPPRPVVDPDDVECGARLAVPLGAIPAPDQACQTAWKWDPGSARKRDPFMRLTTRP